MFTSAAFRFQRGAVTDMKKHYEAPEVRLIPVRPEDAVLQQYGSPEQEALKQVGLGSSDSDK